MSNAALRKLWMDKLPAQMAQILASLPNDLKLQRLAERADKIYDNKPAGTIFTTIQTPTVYSVYLHELIHIKECLADLASLTNHHASKILHAE